LDQLGCQKDPKSPEIQDEVLICCTQEGAEVELSDFEWSGG
jgi:hypothetical protein